MIRSASPPRLAVFAALLLSAAPARGAEEILILPPERASISFTLGATLHTVKGTARLDRGKLEFDAETGHARGEVAVRAKSLTTGNEERDANMQRDVLESEVFPEITFRAERLEVVSRSETTASVVLHGAMEIHGGVHPFAIPADLSASGDEIAIQARFRVPYVEWGMRDYSSFLLRVDPYVDVVVEATANHWR